jgi:cobaltochelatase CobS
VLNQAQVDRWNIVTRLDYLPAADEVAMVLGQVPAIAARGDANELVAAMVATAELTRNGFTAGDISTVMSPRTIVSWAENLGVFGDVARAFRLAFLNKCDDSEVSIVAEYYQRAFSTDLDLS